MCNRIVVCPRNSTTCSSFKHLRLSFAVRSYRTVFKAKHVFKLKMLFPLPSTRTQMVVNIFPTKHFAHYSRRSWFNGKRTDSGSQKCVLVLYNILRAADSHPANMYRSAKIEERIYNRQGSR